MNFDKEFKNDFKKIALNKRENFINKLSSVFDLEPYHFARILFMHYHFFYPKYYFDKAEAIEELNAWFWNGSLYISDLNEKYKGGYKNFGGIKRPLVNDSDEKKWKLAHQNLKNFQNNIKEQYWTDEKRKLKFSELRSFPLVINRKPLTQREAILNETLIEKDGKVISSNFPLLNLSGVLNFYFELIKLNFPFLEYQPKVSDKRFKRFAKKINEDTYVGINFDLGFVNREMKMGYIELPKFYFEIFSSQFKKSISPKNYLNNAEKFPIVQVNPFYLLVDYKSRIAHCYKGKFMEGIEESIKQEMFFYIEAISFIFKFYADYIEEVVKELNLNHR